MVSTRRERHPVRNYVHFRRKNQVSAVNHISQFNHKSSPAILWCDDRGLSLKNEEVINYLINTIFALKNSFPPNNWFQAMLNIVADYETEISLDEGKSVCTP
jgi:hypothetical protein